MVGSKVTIDFKLCLSEVYDLYAFCCDLLPQHSLPQAPPAGATGLPQHQVIPQGEAAQLSPEHEP